MKTTLEVTLRIEVKHSESSLDENSIKALINTGTSAIIDNRRLLSTISDQPAECVSVSVVKFKEAGRLQALSLYGTEAVPWSRISKRLTFIKSLPH